MQLVVQPVQAGSAGPLVSVVRDQRQMQVLAAPAIAPHGSPRGASLRAPPAVRLQWRPVTPVPWLWLAAAVLLALGAPLAWGLPGAVLERDADGHWRLVACNRAVLRRRLERAR